MIRKLQIILTATTALCLTSTVMAQESNIPKCESWLRTIRNARRATKEFMIALLITPIFATAGWALLYLMFGGGLGGGSPLHRLKNVW